MIRGSVDMVDKGVATGWIASESASSALSVEAVVDHQVIGRAVANLPRPDLALAGIGDGRCGFEVRFNSEIDPSYLPFVEVRLAGSDLELPRRSTSGFKDFFRALYQRYPNAGRSASMLGGLWTDRVDVNALIKGRLDIGLLTAADADQIVRFVQDGVLLMNRTRPWAETRTTSRRKEDRLATIVAGLMFDDSVLRFLRMIFDDHPLGMRAEVLDADEQRFSQPSALEDLPSPAECVCVVGSAEETFVAVEVIRTSHRLPEFLSDGSSRWTRAAASRVSELVDGRAQVDRYRIPAGCTAVISPGALHRVMAPTGTAAVKVLVVPARQSLLCFRQQKPRGELTHDSGAAIWL